MVSSTIVVAEGSHQVDKTSLTLADLMNCREEGVQTFQNDNFTLTPEEYRALKEYLGRKAGFVDRGEKARAAFAAFSRQASCQRGCIYGGSIRPVL